MNINNKLIILLLLFFITISSFMYLQTLQKNKKNEFKNYEKTANEITVIKELKKYYGEKKNNKRKIYNIISIYTNKTLSKKETKTTFEFRINKLSHKQLDKLNNDIINSGVKVMKLTLKRTTPHLAELYCKVMF